MGHDKKIPYIHGSNMKQKKQTKINRELKGSSIKFPIPKKKISQQYRKLKAEKNAYQKEKYIEKWLKLEKPSSSETKKKDESLLVLQNFWKPTIKNFKIPTKKIVDHANIKTEYLQTINHHDDVDEEMSKTLTSIDSTPDEIGTIKLNNEGNKDKELTNKDGEMKLDDDNKIFTTSIPVSSTKMVSASFGLVNDEEEDQDILTLCVDEDDSWLYLPIPPRPLNFRFPSE